VLTKLLILLALIVLVYIALLKFGGCQYGNQLQKEGAEFKNGCLAWYGDC
jgi:hypothetical protein